MLRNQIDSATRIIVGEDIENTWFQRDSAVPHYERDVHNYLNKIFVKRWIGKRGPIGQFNCKIFHFLTIFYDYLKNKVYTTKLHHKL